MPDQPKGSTASGINQTLQWVRRNDFKPVPLFHRSKAAINRNYVDPGYVPPDDSLWHANDYGLGLVTGPAHSGPIDADLDSPEGIHFGSLFLPPTQAVFGRASKVDSHRLYRVEEPTFEKIAFIDPMSKETILELRGDGGHQTVMPGSVHEGTGEDIKWSTVPFPTVPTVTSEVLRKAATKVAICSVIARHIWQEGYHNEPCKHLSGMFYRNDWPVEEACEIIQAVMDYTGDKDKSRIPTIKATYRRGDQGQMLTGSVKLREQLGESKGIVVDYILRWLGAPDVAWVGEFNETFAVSMVAGSFRIANTEVPPGEPPVFLHKEDFLNRYSNDYINIPGSDKPVSKARLWLSSPRRRTYDDVRFIPGGEPDFKVGKRNVLNSWTGWAAPPSKDGSCEAWLTLLRDVICGGNDEQYVWMLHWFANILREPQNKCGTAPVLIGEEGAGKSLLVRYFGHILGSNYVVASNEEHIRGKFNKHMATALLLHSEEALYGGDQRHAAIIRSLITDEYMMVEAKGVDAERARNYARLILSSNKTHAAPVALGDRRYTVFMMGDRSVKENETLRDAVLAEEKNGGPAALHHYLTTMDYDPQLPRSNLKNKELLQVKELNLDPIVLWWQKRLETGHVLDSYLRGMTKPAGHHWPDVVSLRALEASYAIYLDTNGIRRPINPFQIRSTLSQMLGGLELDLRRQRYNDLIMEENVSRHAHNLGDGQGRQSSIMNMPTLAKCRKHFEKYIGQELNWDAEPKSDDTKNDDPDPDGKRGNRNSDDF